MCPMRTAQVRLTLLIAVVAATAAAQTTIGPWTVTEYQTPDGETRPLAYTSTTRGGLADLALRCSSTAELGVELVIATGAGLQPADAYRVEVDLGVREPLLDLWTPL